MLVLSISAVKANDSDTTVAISFSEPKKNITGEWLNKNFLPVAAPVLGISSITSAQYIESNINSII